MKKILIMITILLGAFMLSGCSSHSFFYDYDELMQGLISAEIIYIEDKIDFFEVHWYVDIQDTDYEVRKELTPDEADELIRTLSEMRFRYSRIWLPVSVSSVYAMQGYGIRLYYGDNQYIILAQTGDYRHGLPRFGQMLAGRSASDSDWDDFISAFYPD